MIQVDIIIEAHNILSDTRYAVKEKNATVNALEAVFSSWTMQRSVSVFYKNGIVKILENDMEWIYKKRLFSIPFLI